MRWMDGVCLVLAVASAGCIAVPVSGSLEAVDLPKRTVAPLATGEGIVVLGIDLNADEEGMALCVREGLRRANPTLRIMDAREFRNALFPWFDSGPASEELLAVLAKPLVRNGIAKLSVRYGIIVGQRVWFSRGEEKGIMGYGVGWVATSSTLAADLWDFGQAAYVGRVEARGSGSEGIVGIFPFMLGWFSDSETAACRGLGQRLAELLAAGKLSSEPEEK